MNAAEARAYRERWREVAEIERREAQSATVQDRWRQLNAVFGMAQSLGLLEKLAADQEETIWQRWVVLTQVGSYEPKKYRAS
ncbi:MAG: hypothetical protein AB1649_25615 [Chloroflexota bacterium]